MSLDDRLRKLWEASMPERTPAELVTAECRHYLATGAWRDGRWGRIAEAITLLGVNRMREAPHEGEEWPAPTTAEVEKLLGQWGFQ